MLVYDWDRMVATGKKCKKPRVIHKTCNHCYDGCGWNMCDFWWIDKDGDSRCAMFGNAVKWKSESLRICHELYGHYYEGKP